MKYIVTQQDNGEEEIFIFPREVNHDCMAEALRRIKNRSWGNWERISRDPISAGFIEGGKCVGKSESLNLASRGNEDTRLLDL